MPINPNIALGAQPQTQPINMLGQMGQLYALKAAKQEFEGSEALRDAFASGGDLNDPAFVQRLRAANPKMAMDIEAKHLAGQKTRSELEANAYKNIRETLTMVNSPESLRAFSLSQFNDPIIGPRLKAIGLTPEIALANLDKEIATVGFNGALKKAAMGLDRFFTDETSRRNQDVAVGPQYARLAFDKEKDAREQRQQDEIARILRGEPPAGAGATTPPPAGGGVPVVGATAPAGGGAPVAGAVTPVATPATTPNVNALNAGATPAPAGNVNALTEGAVSPQVAQIRTQISQLIRSGNPKSIAVAEALIKEHNILNPAGKLERDANGTLMVIDERSGVAKPVIGKDGKPLASGPAPVWNEKAQVYITPPTPDNPTAKVTEVPELRQIAKKRSALETLDIAGFNKTTGTNEISDLIKQSTSGLTENALAKTAGALFGKGTPGAEAIATLETRANELTLGLAPNGSLGAGFSNDDRTFMLAKLGDVANANKPMNVRLAAWEDVMKRASRNAGIDYKGSGGGGSAPASSGAGVTVSAGGTTYTFPNQDAANKFKQAAGIK